MIRSFNNSGRRLERVKISHTEYNYARGDTPWAAECGYARGEDHGMV